jgi:hypothetical protein
MLLSGLMASDGYSERCEYGTSSDTLAAHVAIVILCAGYAPTIRYAKTAQSWYLTYKSSDKAKTGLVKSITRRLPAKIKSNYECSYDLTVEKEHSFVVGFSVVHNCHRIGQHNPVTVIDVIAKNTMEVALLANARKKIDTENRILTHKQLLGE